MSESTEREWLFDSLAPETVKRPDSVPEVGVIPAFDAGWNAHRVGLDRETVVVLGHPSGRGWALLGYDVRAKLAENGE